jgi:hypothetical protein
MDPAHCLQDEVEIYKMTHVSQSEENRGEVRRKSTVST